MQPVAVTVPYQKFYPVAVLVHEHENTVAQRVHLEMAADYGTESVKALSHIDRLAAQMDRVGRNVHHWPTPIIEKNPATSFNEKEP